MSVDIIVKGDDGDYNPVDSNHPLPVRIIGGGGGGGGAVDSVNGQTGEVVLTAADVGALPDDYTPAWGDVADKPTTFPPAAHTHAVADVTGLGDALDGKVSKADQVEIAAVQSSIDLVDDAQTKEALEGLLSLLMN